MRDVHRLEHIQTHCRDVLYDLERCAQTYEAFVQKPKLMERMRVALYHIGELAEGLTDTFRAVSVGAVAHATGAVSRYALALVYGV